MRPLCSLTALMLELLLGRTVGTGSLHVLPVVQRFTAINEICRTAPHERREASRRKLHHIGMYTAVAARHLYSAPGTALIVGDLKRRRVSGQTGCAVAAQPVCEYPAPTCKHLDGLAAEASLPGKQHIRFCPKRPPSVLFCRRMTDVNCILSLPGTRSS